MASVASSASPPKDTAPGTNIMVAGIVFQMAAITVFCGLFAVFLRRAKGLDRRVKVLVAATVVGVAFIYVRSIYRTVELLEGWDGYLITHEVYFIVLDGAMMVGAVVVFNVVHPAGALKGAGGKARDMEMGSRPFSTATTVKAGEEEEGEGKEGSVRVGGLMG